MSTASLERPAAGSTEETGALGGGRAYRMSAAEFFKAVDAGVFTEGHRIGLWEGQLYEKMAKKLPHSIASSKVTLRLVQALPPGWCLWPDNPILLNNFSAPLPDFSIVRGIADDYGRRNSVPRPEDIGLVVELSDATLARDRAERLQTFARAGLPTYWIVNLVDRRVEVYARPVADDAGARYASSEVYEPGRDLPLVLDGREATRIPVSELLPGETA